ncbi:MAG: hypothetical protein AAFX44_06450 [Pseudomonadota bacterium]
MEHRFRALNFIRPTMLAAFLIATVPCVAEAGDHRSWRSRVIEQLTQFDGGCPPNVCEDVQVSVHNAPVCPHPVSQAIGDYSIGAVREFDGSLSGGTSRLVRANDGVAFDMSATGLRRDAPYTVWWVAFNPDNPCITSEDPCACDENSLRPGQDSVFYATGGMTDVLGVANFAAHIEYGDVPTGYDQTPFGGAFAVGIEPGAEIHLIVRDHGRALWGWRGRRILGDND